METISDRRKGVIQIANLQNPVKAIRAKCLECSCGSSTEVQLCPVTDCALYPFRFGRNPYRTKREMTEEQKAACVARLAEAQARKHGNVSDCV